MGLLHASEEYGRSALRELLHDRESTRVETVNVGTRFFILNSISTIDDFKEADAHLSAASV